MGNCGSIYTPEYCRTLTGEPLDADPDIVGPGVLAGFALTALVTIGAIVLGYFTKALPDGYIDGTDEVFIERVNSSKLISWLGNLCARTSSLVRKALFLGPAKSSGKVISKEQKQQMLEKFILALSDQQLVTGIAVLVAGFSAHCRISVYELNVVVSLAWFSSATHLATLDVLQDYLRRNTVVRNWRMVGMVSIVLLLIPGLILGAVFSTWENDVPIQCNQTGDLFNPFSLIGIMFTVFYLIYGYGSRLSRTFTSEDGIPISINRLCLISVMKYARGLHEDWSRDVVDKAIKLQKANEAQYHEKLLQTATDEGKTVIARKVAEVSIALTAYSRTFLQVLGSLSFMLSYGISQVAGHRWLAAPPQLDPKSNRMDFGQIVPLVLLVIPILAAAEVLYERPEEEAKLHSTRSSSASSSRLSDTLGDRQRSGHELLPSTTGDAATIAQQASHSVDTTNPVENPEQTGTTNTVSLGDQRGHGRHSRDLHTGTRLENAQRSSQTSASHRYVGSLFMYHVLVAISVGVVLNIGTSAVIGGGVILLSVFAIILFKWLGKLIRILRNIRKIIDDDNGAHSSTRTGVGGQSVEMRTPSSNPSHSASLPATHRSRHTASREVQSAPRSQGSQDSGYTNAYADEPDFVRPNRQDTEARIGDSSTIPSVGVTRRATGQTSNNSIRH